MPQLEIGAVMDGQGSPLPVDQTMPEQDVIKERKRKRTSEEKDTEVGEACSSSEMNNLLPTMKKQQRRERSPNGEASAVGGDSTEEEQKTQQEVEKEVEQEEEEEEQEQEEEQVSKGEIAEDGNLASVLGLHECELKTAIPLNMDAPNPYRVFKLPPPQGHLLRFTVSYRKPNYIFTVTAQLQKYQAKDVKWPADVKLVVYLHPNDNEGRPMEGLCKPERGSSVTLEVPEEELEKHAKDMLHVTWKID